MSGKGEVSFKEPWLVLAYLQAFASRSRGSYYGQYIESLHLGESETILEYGSGPGVASVYLARALPKGHLTCVDISKVWIGFAKRATGKFSNVDFRQGDLSGLKLKDESYDGVFIHFMLHDIPESQRSEKVGILVSKLKKGGKIYIREPTREKHGMPAGEIRDLMTEHELKEISSETGKSPQSFPTFQGIYAR
jgi:ubiquinone/menaquinone biosynthesis C-methylase UbiE